MYVETDLDSLLDLVRRHYSIDIAEAKPLGGELDTNVYVRDSEGNEFTVKRSATPSASNIRWQYPLLEHLKSRLMGIDVPVIEPTIDGGRDVVIDDGQGVLVVRVAHWVSGRIMGELEKPSARLLQEWGALAANCVLALSDYPAATVPRTHYWDIRRGPAAIEEALPSVKDSDKVAAVMSIVDEARCSITWLEDQPQQVVHQDLNDFNVVVETTAERVSGLLDVGDAILAPRASEVIVAGAYGMLRQTDPVAAFHHVLDGYSTILPISDEDRRHILALAAIRLCVNATTWTHRQANAQDDYGNRRMAATWPAIEKIAAL